MQSSNIKSVMNQEKSVSNSLNCEKDSIQNEYGFNSIISEPICIPAVELTETVINWSENAAKESKIHPQIAISTNIDISSFVKETNAKLNELLINNDNLKQELKREVSIRHQNEISNKISDIINKFYDKFVYSSNMTDYYTLDRNKITANTKFYDELNDEAKQVKQELNTLNPEINYGYVARLKKKPLHFKLFSFLEKKKFDLLEFMKLTEIKKKRNNDNHLDLSYVNQNYFVHEMQLLLNDNQLNNFHVYFDGFTSETFPNLIKILSN